MRYEFHPEAEVDLVETILYYETQALGLGGRFAAEVERAIEQLNDAPLLFPDGAFEARSVLERFLALSREMPAEIVHFVAERLREHPEYRGKT